MKKLTVRTPEGVLFSFTLASPLSRFLAWIVDALAIVALSSAVGTCISILALVSFDFARAITILCYFAISIGYGIVLEWYWRGQTLGKRLLRLRVMDERGLRLHFNQIVVRNLLRPVDMLPGLYALGGVASLLSRRAQRLGDLAANTVVIRSPKIAEPDLDQLVRGKFNSLRQFPHLEARLRQHISPAEAAVMLEALLRRDEFEAAARVSLFAEMAAHCRSQVHFPPEATDSMADEQYVRNVADILFRKRQPAGRPRIATRGPSPAGGGIDTPGNASAATASTASGSDAMAPSAQVKSPPDQ
ncbi:MAG TPA: RDD family protein [Chthoniobacteraceae bacterium]|jgi:uncharacterized RDD family membrane protein YckC|nr:RDD family protein [Chthoniobacteraceae bacterium]